METMRSQPRRGVTVVASHSYGWYKGTVEKRAFRYATASNPCRVPTARLLLPPCYQPFLRPFGSKSDKVERKWLAAWCLRRFASRRTLSDAYGIGCAINGAKKRSWVDRRNPSPELTRNEPVTSDVNGFASFRIFCVTRAESLTDYCRGELFLPFLSHSSPILSHPLPSLTILQKNAKKFGGLKKNA